MQRAPQSVDAKLPTGLPVAAPRSDTELAATCVARPECAVVLRLLSARPTTVMLTDDIAAGSGLGAEQVQRAINTLSNIGFLRRLCVGAWTFFGLTQETARLEDVKGFEDWCSERRRGWESLREVIG
jgi:hypothetical protein